jgi:N-acetylmuramoyl-L-alanine amidase
MPAALLEAGIIVNRDDEIALAEPTTRERISQAIGDGLASCLRGR